ncbi:MAG: hypothetical protein ABFC77_07240 [Thermoguttaceae bacterium]
MRRRAGSRADGHRLSRRLLLAAMVFGVALGGNKSVGGADFRKKPAAAVNVTWSGVPLRRAVEGLARAQQTAIVIDRRVDPGQPLTLSLQNATAEQVLRAVADRCGLGVARLGNILYLGPSSVAERLASVTAAFGRKVRGLPTAAQRTFFQRKPLAWDDLASPRALLAELAQQNHLEIVGLERAPHDLWAAANLPACSLVDRLSLIAIQFDLTFDVTDGATIELVPCRP